MTKKDYELIASVVIQSNEREKIAFLFAEVLASKNPRFDKEKFLIACGVEVEHKHKWGISVTKNGKQEICLDCRQVR